MQQYSHMPAGSLHDLNGSPFRNEWKYFVISRLDNLTQPSDLFAAIDDGSFVP